VVVPARHGTVSVLFTDVVGSTALMQRLGDDRYDSLRRLHMELLRGQISVAVFVSAIDAVGCAVAMQQEIHRHHQQYDEADHLPLRVGIDVGEPIREGNDYHGTPVVVASRLSNDADGGQILVSQLLRRLVGNRGEYTFRDLEPRLVKGISDSFPLCEVGWEPVREEVPAEVTSIERQPVTIPLPAELASIGQTPFVGRGAEIEKLDHCWQLAVSGQRQLAVVVGDAGVGKTRLVAEFARKLHEDGATVLFGRADRAGLSQYQPVAEVLAQYVASLRPDEVLRLRTRWPNLVGLVPKLRQSEDGDQREEPSLPESDEDHFRLIQSVTALFDEIDTESPILLVVDDLHWAAKPTFQLLSHLVRAPGSRRLLIGTYREAGLARTDPLSEAVADLRRDRSLQRISLSGLDKGETAALIGDAQPGIVAAVYDQTEGNPFFIEEVLRHLEETEAVTRRNGRLVAPRAITQHTIPESLRDVMGQRLSRLSDECASVLTIASVIGRHFSVDALERASDVSGGQLLELLEEAVGAGVIEEVQHAVGHYGFLQALLYETFYDELTRTRRVRLHGQTLQYADSNGTKLAYEVLGSSGPYVMVIGLSSCPAVRARNRGTATRWDRLSRNCQVILYDRRGVGASAAPDHGYSQYGSVEDIDAVLTAAGVERAVMWGATDGGPLAIAYAARYPDRVAGLVLAGTSAKYMSSENFALGVSPESIQSFLQTGSVDQGRAVTELTQTRYGSSDAEPIGEVMKLVPRRVWSKVIGGAGAGDARSYLARIQAPTLIIHDPENDYIPAEAARHLHEHISGSQLEITEEYRPGYIGDALHGKIEDFIETVSAASPA
jgi:pimeloyl-ACP methyl ester carboxylesterase/class 3 adenylate cyclase